MQATIEIDLGPLNEEWKVTRIGKPNRGEQVVIGKLVITAERDWAADAQIIVRRKWAWPSWLKARWYAEAASGVAMASNDPIKPTASQSSWRGCWYILYEQYIDTPRIGGDWKQSLRENPNWRSDNGQKDT